MSVIFKTFTGTPNGPAVAKTFTRPALTGNQVLVKTTHSGVCGTDVHYHHGGIGMGHEGAGIVTQVGPEVTNHRVGDRVAWGWVYGSCGECASCQSGYIAMCEKSPKQYGQIDFDQGSFSTGGVWDSRFVYKIPDSISSEDAAPLLCGGWTVWNALMGYDLKPTDHIGIVGIGGLGHLAIQFANKMGCEVTTFSGTESQKADSLALGAHHFITTSNVPEGESLKVSRKIDKLLVCINVQSATVFPLQIPEDMSSKLSVPHMPFLMKSINVVYSTNGRHDAYDKMLAFTALHGIKPVSEKFLLNEEGIEIALKNLGDGAMRYRGLLVSEE